MLQHFAYHHNGRKYYISLVKLVVQPCQTSLEDSFLTIPAQIVAVHLVLSRQFEKFLRHRERWRELHHDERHRRQCRRACIVIIAKSSLLFYAFET